MSRHAVPLNGHDENIFIAEVSDWLTHANDDEKFDKLVIAASPKTLGYIRDKLDKRVKEKITREMDKDYINTPLPELEDALLKKAST